MHWLGSLHKLIIILSLLDLLTQHHLLLQLKQGLLLQVEVRLLAEEALDDNNLRLFALILHLLVSFRSFDLFCIERLHDFFLISLRLQAMVLDGIHEEGAWTVILICMDRRHRLVLSWAVALDFIRFICIHDAPVLLKLGLGSHVVVHHLGDWV